MTRPGNSRVRPCRPISTPILTAVLSWSEDGESQLRRSIEHPGGPVATLPSMETLGLVYS